MIVLGSSNALWESLVPAVVLLELLKYVWKSLVETLVPRPPPPQWTHVSAESAGRRDHGRTPTNKSEMAGGPPDTFNNIKIKVCGGVGGK